MWTGTLRTRTSCQVRARPLRTPQAGVGLACCCGPSHPVRARLCLVRGLRPELLVCGRVCMCACARTRKHMHTCTHAHTTTHQELCGVLSRCLPFSQQTPGQVHPSPPFCRWESSDSGHPRGPGPGEVEVPTASSSAPASPQESRRPCAAP